MAVVFGGRGSEHAISCLGAGNVLAALDRDRYEVVPVGHRPGRPLGAGPGRPGQLAIAGGELPSVEAMSAARRRDRRPPRPGAPAAWWSRPRATPRAASARSTWCCRCCTAPYGEDGTIQGLLEMAGARYAGAGVFASAAGMDKEYMKLIFAARGLPIGPLRGRPRP